MKAKLSKLSTWVKWVIITNKKKTKQTRQNKYISNIINYTKILLLLLLCPHWRTLMLGAIITAEKLIQLKCLLFGNYKFDQIKILTLIYVRRVQLWCNMCVCQKRKCRLNVLMYVLDIQYGQAVVSIAAWTCLTIPGP